MPDTPMPDQPEFDAADPDFDGQDMAEVFDEDNQLTEERRMAGGDDGLTFEGQPSLYDATTAVGDSDDDDALIGDDMDDSEIVELSTDTDVDDEDVEDDPYVLRNAEEGSADLDFDDDDRDEDDGVVRLSPEEARLLDAGDLNNAQHAEGSAKRMESNRLSDEEITDLGYSADSKTSRTPKAAEDQQKPGDSAGANPNPGEPRSFNPASDRSDAENEKHDRQDELLDQGVEETFPASDPVSVKHIT